MFLLFFVVIAAFCLGMTGYHYLYSREKTDFYHSLPLKRERIFFVPYVSGILIFAVPYLINLLLALLERLREPFPHTPFHWHWGRF